MCKIMVLSGIDHDKSDLAWKFVKAMAKEMTFGNNDGLGYAAIGGDGSLFGERWLKNHEAFETRNPLTPLEAKVISAHKGVISRPITYNRFGVVSENHLRSITLHTRMATSGKEFENTHPFVFEDTSLIHNGVVNDDKLDLIQSTCDSEGILNAYLEANVNLDINEIQTVADRLEGYYACAVFSKDAEGTVILDVFKDTSAQLHAAWINELNCLVISTAMHTIEQACKKCEFTIGSEFVVNSGYIWRYNALTGEVIDVKSFTPGKLRSEKKAEKKTNVTVYQGGGNGTGTTHTHGGTSVTKGSYFKDRSGQHNRGIESMTSDIKNLEDWEYDDKTKVWSKVYEGGGNSR